MITSAKSGNVDPGKTVLAKRTGGEGCVEMRFHNRFICVGVDISIYALITGGRS